MTTEHPPPTTVQQARNAIKWINTLPKYKKTTGQLYKSDLNRYCCLGVACVSIRKPILYTTVEKYFGLRSEDGVLSPMIHGKGALTILNDDTYRLDDDFKNIRKDILENIGSVFKPKIASIVKKHFANNAL